MNSEKIKISIVNYTNTIPFKWALKKSELISRIDLQEDIPSICAQKLKFNQVDLALVPIALLVELDTYFIETNYCIGANGKVDSVKLYSQVPLNKIETIVLDYQSKTSIALTKILAKHFWKINPKYEEAKPGFENKIEGSKAAVVIGDRTFTLNGNFNYELDLAEEWKRFTGLPFVFAVWASTKKLDDKFISKFNLVLEHGLKNISEAVNELQTPELKKYSLNYLQNKIDFNLDEKKREAMKIFLNYF